MTGTGWERSKLWVLFFTAAILAGCATAAQRQAQQSGAAFREAAAENKACVAAHRARPEYGALLPHQPDLDTGQYTMAQLTDETRPTPMEAKSLASGYDEITICRTHFLNSLSSSRPDIVPILAATYTKGAETTVLLVQRKITWGEASRRGQERLSDLRQKLATADRQWIADLNASHQAEMAQRQAAADALMQLSAQQQMINAMNRPRQTNCYGFGNSVNCTSY